MGKGWGIRSKPGCCFYLVTGEASSPKLTPLNRLCHHSSQSLHFLGCFDREWRCDPAEGERVSVWSLSGKGLARGRT